ncbi:DUF1501 domain-containing protein [Aliagarivorans marinus]|uniref:DUF1501 domain-containing protein n=1 Tax=Aliagarivorans marinus TaxID=561965 RepID=UPI0003F76E39|nr:DUF1501 domain-containing protein [Aliagarivorans marinus]
MTISRRNFLKKAGLLGSVPLVMSLPKTAAAADGDYKALVCVFLRGGNDSANMIMTTDEQLHAAYASRRPDIAKARDSLLDTGTSDWAGNPIALNPAMVGMQSLFLEGKAAAILNIGPRIGPIGSGQRNPPGLFNHSRQQYAWETSWNLSTDEYGPFGWGGMMMDILAGSGSVLPSLVSLGSNTLLKGAVQADSRVGSDGSLVNLTAFSASPEAEAAFESSVGTARRSLFTRQMQYQQDEFVQGFKVIREAVEGTALDTNIDGGTSLGRQLRAVKRVIDASMASGTVSRQVFIVNMGGFDTHRNQIPRHDGLLGQVSSSISDFTLALGANQSSVTTFTASDFGRTIHNNGNKGTDHGWGSFQFVAGGAVNPGAYGTYPDLSVGSPDDYGRGRLTPTLAHEQMAATMGRWMGLSDSSLAAIFPSLFANFSMTDLGFMS